MRRLLPLLVLAVTLALCAGWWGCYDPTYPPTYCCGQCGDGATCLYTKVKDAEGWVCVAHDAGKATADAGADAGVDVGGDVGGDAGIDTLPADTLPADTLPADTLPADAAAETAGD
jgi:hypothetical protein